jgi:hypothetical protein
MNEATPTYAELRQRAVSLRLHGLQTHWAEAMGDPQQAQWVPQILAWEAAAMRAARLGSTRTYSACRLRSIPVSRA